MTKTDRDRKKRDRVLFESRPRGKTQAISFLEFLLDDSF